MPPPSRPGYINRMNLETAQEKIALLRRQVTDQEARLEAYKGTLEEIYSLYDSRVEELSLIRRLSDSLRTIMDLKKVSMEIVGVVMEELGPDACGLFLFDRNNKLKIKASGRIGEEPSYWPDNSPVQAGVTPLLAGPMGRVMESGDPLLLDDLSPDQAVADTLLSEARSLLCLPLISRQKNIGLFTLISQNEQAFGQDDLRILTIICDQAAIALYNVRLFSDLRRSNRALRQSEKRALLAWSSLDRMLENANDLIINLDSTGRISYVNRRSRSFGYLPEQLLNQPLDFLLDLPGDDPARTESDPARVIEAVLITASGQNRTALVSFTPLPPGEPDDPVMLVIARDVTERNQLERQLFHSEKLASVGLLAAGVAHEIGNPLAAILGYAQILKKPDQDPAVRGEWLTAIQSEAERIERIIKELLAYSRPSQGLRDRLSVNEAVSSILAMLTNQKLFRGIDVSMDLDPANPTVIMDRDHLTQVMVNLVVNAAHALDGRGWIKVSTRLDRPTAVISIRDNGPGVPAELIDRIFDPFFTTKAVGQGTGLGLSICHRIVESEGGSIRLNQTGPGTGAEFEIRLPLAEED